MLELNPMGMGSLENLIPLAVEIGLDENKFKECFNINHHRLGGSQHDCG
jgi:hypothetical protein